MVQDLSSLLDMYSEVKPELYFRLRKSASDRYLKHVTDNSNVKNKKWLFAVEFWDAKKNIYVFAGLVNGDCRKDACVKLQILVDRFGKPLVNPRLYGYPFLASQKSRR